MFTKINTLQKTSLKEDQQNFQVGYKASVEKVMSDNKSLSKLICCDCGKPMKRRTMCTELVPGSAVGPTPLGT